MTGIILVLLSVLFVVAAQGLEASTSQVNKRQADQYNDRNYYNQNQYGAVPGSFGRYNTYTPYNQYNPYSTYKPGYSGYNSYDSRYPYYSGSTASYPGTYNNPAAYPGGGYNSAAFGTARNYPYSTPVGK